MLRRPTRFQTEVSEAENHHSRWPIEEVLLRLGWDGHAKKQGKWAAIRCPFHDDKRIGNAGYNVSLNSFRCHACGTAGNSVTLVMHVKGTDQQTAVEWLSSQVNDTTTSKADAPGQQTDRLLGGTSAAYDSMFRGLRR